jgi:ABC-type transport system involved in cytochrome c biogenesis permease subunit
MGSSNILAKDTEVRRTTITFWVSFCAIPLSSPMVSFTEHSVVKSESMAIHVSAAMTAGATGSLLTHPVWVVKTRVMVRTSTT